MRVTNTSRDTACDFVVKDGKVSKDGVPETVSVGPGETATINVADSDLVKLQAKLAFGNLTASDREVEKASDALASEPDPAEARIRRGR